MQWMDDNAKKIKQFFRGREFGLQEVLDNIDEIEDFEVQLEEVPMPVEKMVE